ncbi:MAG: dihydropteroate synthase-like protein [Methanosarcinales archaeon]|nr:MAG: dihydropteroate synthase-like protein [Methanosarcinales archaeon]
MKILVLTGRLAEHIVERAVDVAIGGDIDVFVKVVDVDVASFITRRHLDSLDISGYDMVLVPGLVSGDFSAVEKKYGVPVRRGPKHAVDLGFVLNFADTVEFSHSIPACELLSSKNRRKAFETVVRLEAGSTCAFTIRDTRIGGNSRMKVMAEVVGADSFSEAELGHIIRLFVHEGADIIDLGMSLDAQAEDATRAMKTARRICDVPVSIDTLDPDLLAASIDAGANLCLSLNSKNMDAVAPLAVDVPCVIIPDLRHDASARANIRSLEKNVAAAKEYKIKHIIADPVLDAINHGFSKSVIRFMEFHRRNPDVPLFFGVGNVSELVDIDSNGVNGLLAGIGCEIGASILFTPEFSDKNKGSIRELKIASEMMILSKYRESAPKDLGIDLLRLKEKRRRPFDIPPPVFIPVRTMTGWELDPAGCVKISITEGNVQNGKTLDGIIIASHRNGVVVGRNASEVLDTLIDRGFVSTLHHAGYLGRELARAELALNFGRSFVQDGEF